LHREAQRDTEEKYLEYDKPLKAPLGGFGGVTKEVRGERCEVKNLRRGSQRSTEGFRGKAFGIR
jgi:hypothetical protein